MLQHRTALFSLLLLLSMLMSACLQGPTTGGETHWQGNDTFTSSDTGSSGSDTGTCCNSQDINTGQDTGTTQDTSSPFEPYMIPDNQSTSPEVRLVHVNAVPIQEVFVNTESFVAIYEGNTTDTLVGHAPVTVIDGSGPENDLIVPLMRDAVNGEVLTAVLIADIGEVGTFEEGVDPPIVSPNSGNEIRVTFNVSYPFGSLDIQDQTLEQASTLIQVQSAATPGRGWLVIHPDNGSDAPDTSVVLAALPSLGQITPNVDRIALSTPTTDASVLFAVLYEEEGTNPNTFDANEDTALSSPAAARFVTTVPAGTPAVRLTFEAEDGVGYRVATMPGEFADSILSDPAAVNPTLTLQAGWRYAFDTTSNAHPIELIDDTDAVLLSQTSAATPALESDTDVAWDESDARVLFTTVPALVSAPLDGYQSANDTSLTGSISVQ